MMHPPSSGIPIPTAPMTNPHRFNHMEANGGDQIGQKPVQQSFIVAMNVINTVTQVLLGGVVIAAFIAANRRIDFEVIWPALPPWMYTNYDTEHIYLCVFGYMVLMSQAILTFSPFSGWGNTLEHSQKRTIHLIMQISGSALAIIGSVLKISDDSQSFHSAHGIIGIIAMMLTIISLISGVLNLAFPAYTKSNWYKICHGSLGSLTITVAFTSLAVAFHTQARSWLGNINANLAILTTVGALSGVLASSSTRIFRRFYF